MAANVHRLPRDLDLIVGVPRSGLLAANMLSLITNLPLADLDGYLERRIVSAGRTKAHDRLTRSFDDIRTVLILDDSINGGEAMAKARARVEGAGLGHKCIFAAVYGIRPEHENCDLVFEVLPQPRLFQWNLMHHKFLESACVDIDGVLCRDPTREENDDGARYVDFLLNATPLHLSTRRIRTLVTSRLEKYRAQTEAWLARHDVRYDELVMLDLPNAEARRKANAHGLFKAEYYKKSDAIVFIESELPQARKIAHHSRKPVICLETHTLFDRHNASQHGEHHAAINRKVTYREPLPRRLKSALQATIGAENYRMLKRLRVRPQR